LLCGVSLAHTCSHFVAETNTALRHGFDVLIVHGFLDTDTSDLCFVKLDSSHRPGDLTRVDMSKYARPRIGSTQTAAARHRPGALPRLNMLRHVQRLLRGADVLSLVMSRYPRHRLSCSAVACHV
jgi:hypothetical protein